MSTKLIGFVSVIRPVALVDRLPVYSRRKGEKR